ncbi:MAG: site-specific integrase [Gammaproteobacteria bacterium]
MTSSKIQSIQSVTALTDYYIYRKVLEQQTIKHYHRVARILLRDVSDRIADLDECRLITWRSAVLERASATTFNNYLRHLRAIFRYGYQRNVIDYNPFKELSSAPQTIKKYKTLETGVFEKAIFYLRHNEDVYPGWFWVSFLVFMGLTAVRARQVANLTWQDVDFDRQLISLTASGSKTHREWDISMLPHVEHQLRLLHERAARLCRVKETDQVFNVTLYAPHYAGNKLTTGQINQFFRRLSDKIGQKIGSRRLRHSFATMFVNSEAGDILVLNKILGHTKLETTKIYTRIKPDHMYSVMDRAISSQVPASISRGLLKSEKDHDNQIK